MLMKMRLLTYFPITVVARQIITIRTKAPAKLFYSCLVSDVVSVWPKLLKANAR